MKTLITLLLAGVFTGNLITSNLLGIEGMEKNNKSMLSLLKSGTIITVLLLVSSAVTYPIGAYVMAPLKLGFLSSLFFTLIIFGILFGAFLLSEKFLPCLSAFLKENCETEALVPMVLAVCLMNIGSEIATNYLLVLLLAVISGIGYTLVSLILFAVNERLQTAELPNAVKGLPITLIILSLISLAFGGFAGI